MNSIETFRCPICGNSNPIYIGMRKGHPYCRKCITFKGQEAEGNYIQSENADYKLAYNLSNDQLKLSKQLLENYINGYDTLVHAVCGSGKTEIVLETIKYAIESGKKVGFAIPRKDVVRELTTRFKGIFKNNKVESVYGGHTSKIEGDLVCITTHQLFRYRHYFDLLIIDEVDAFPFNDNEVLESFLKNSVKGNMIMMSATPPQRVVDDERNMLIGPVETERHAVI